jgi:flagellar motor protein MotB
MADLPEDEEPTTSVRIMFTFSDLITALLTFFVLLITFSGTSDETYGPVRGGLLKGSKTPPLFPAAEGKNSPIQENKRLAASRLDTTGAEKPPMNGESPLDELKYYYPDVDISKLKELKGALIVRVPIVQVFGTGMDLAPEGKKFLDSIAKMTRGHAYSIIVRVRAHAGVSPEQRESSSLVLALQAVRYLCQSVGKACEDIGLSNDVGLAETPLPEGQCEVIMLEV